MYKQILAIVLVMVGCNQIAATPGQIDAERQLEKIKQQAQVDEKLGQYTVNMMHRSVAGSHLSAAYQLSLAGDIVEVADNILETEDHRRGWIVAVEIESQFQRFAQSPTGPKGFGQLAKKSFHEALEACGLKNVNDGDVWDTKLNLYASACYFRMMLELPNVNGDPGMAIVAYNQGPNAESIKTYSRSGDIANAEALKYVAKFTYLKGKNTDAKTPDAPAIADLPKPGPVKKHKDIDAKKGK